MKNKNWFQANETLWQEECPGEEWHAVEDYQKEAVMAAWERLSAVIPMWGIVDYEMLERFRKTVLDEL